MVRLNKKRSRSTEQTVQLTSHSVACSARAPEVNESRRSDLIAMDRSLCRLVPLYTVCLLVLLSGSGSLLRRGDSGVEAGCVELGRCCDGKNSACRAVGPRMNNALAKVCFCDSNCQRKRDCCTDYNVACQGQSMNTVLGLVNVY